MRLQRYAVPSPHLPRRSLLKGGAGLVTGVVLGGLQESYDVFAASEPPPPPPAPPQPVPEPDPEPEPEPEPQPPTHLGRGSAGEEVWALQEQLGSSGYWCGIPDGGFGHLTEQAVYAIQKAHGLTRDGIAGPATLAAVATARMTLPAPVTGGDHVEVHLASQLILLVRGGSTAMVLNTSTGNGEPYEYQGGDYLAHTPTGDFEVWYVDGSGWRTGELGELYRPMFYSGNFAIHGSDSIPPWPASHGCARVSVAAMDMIWAQGLLGMGDRVLVV